MDVYLVDQLVEASILRETQMKGVKVLVVGVMLKENFPDLRNTRVAGTIRSLGKLGVTVLVHDPWGDPEEARSAFGIDMVAKPDESAYDAILLAVAHTQSGGTGARERRKTGGKGTFFAIWNTSCRKGDGELQLWTRVLPGIADLGDVVA